LCKLRNNRLIRRFIVAVFLQSFFRNLFFYEIMNNHRVSRINTSILVHFLVERSRLRKEQNLRVRLFIETALPSENNFPYFRLPSSFSYPIYIFSSRSDVAKKIRFIHNLIIFYEKGMTKMHFLLLNRHYNIAYKYRSIKRYHSSTCVFRNDLKKRKEKKRRGTAE